MLDNNELSVEVCVGIIKLCLTRLILEVILSVQLIFCNTFKFS